MNKDYNLLLESLLSRRYDEARRESIVSDAFEECGYPDCMKYVLESMEEIDPSYAYKTFHITKRIQEKIDKAFKARNIEADFRYQGAIQTETHVMLHGGVELLVLSKIKDKKPWAAVANSAREIMDVLSGDPTFKEVDYSNRLDIKLVTLKPRCEVKILPALWLNNEEYMKTKREIDRGICEFNLEKKTRRKYLPFLNMARLNSKDSRCNGGLKRMIRLLISLTRDSADKIQLNSYQVSSLLYAIPDKQLNYNPNYALSLIGVVAAQLNRLVSDDNYRSKLLSPSEKELVFGTNPIMKHELEKLKNLVDAIIGDLQVTLKATGKTLYSEIRYSK